MRSPRRARIAAREALAYMKSGWLAPLGARRVIKNPTLRAARAVLFVPGVGANASQFTPLSEALARRLSPPAADPLDVFGGGRGHRFEAFHYSSLEDPRAVARALKKQIEALGGHSAEVLLVGHSLGGLLARMVLQAVDAPPTVAGLVSLCAPLQGTWVGKWAPAPPLRALAPDSALMAELGQGAARLDPWRGRILAVGSRRDQFVVPYDSAFLDGHERVLLEDHAHVSPLFDPQVHEVVGRFAERVFSPAAPPPAPPRR